MAAFLRVFAHHRSDATCVAISFISVIVLLRELRRLISNKFTLVGIRVELFRCMRTLQAGSTDVPTTRRAALLHKSSLFRSTDVPITVAFKIFFDGFLFNDRAIIFFRYQVNCYFLS